MSIAAWTQYVLDSFETVEEAVAELRKEAFRPSERRCTQRH